MMKWLSFCFAFFFSFSLMAQYLEVVIGLGTSNYLGDLSSNSSKIDMTDLGFSGSAFARYNVSDFVSVKLGFGYHQISGEDENATNPVIEERNLSFRSDIFEGTLTGEFNILGFQPYGLRRIFSPYVFAGIGLYHFNPKTEFQGAVVALQPLGTEGQGIAGFAAPYSLTQFSIPFGLGAKFALNDKVTLGLEFGVRKTFTDYLDDVSQVYADYFTVLEQNGEIAANLSTRVWEYYGTEPFSMPVDAARGDNNPTDWIFSLQFTVSYNFLDNGLVGFRGNNKRRSGCQTF